MSLNEFFNSSSFYCVNKNEEFSSEDLVIINELILPEKINRYHPDRKKEYILGRLCAYKAYLRMTKKKLLQLHSSEDRAPIWPEDVVGSISHNSHYVCVVMALKTNIRSIGIDIEEKGRTKLELSSHIRVEQDLKSHANFTDKELLTLIFSAKESLFKTLYPLVKSFFGFEAAYVSDINIIDNSFTINLLVDLNEEFNMKSKCQFKGYFTNLDNSLITKIELK